MSGELDAAAAMDVRGRGRPYLARWRQFEMSRLPQTSEHVLVVYAYDAADARVEAEAFLKELGSGSTSREVRRTLQSVRPPLTKADQRLLADAELCLPQSRGHGYTMELRNQ